MIVDAPKKLDPVQRALGVDPGAPFAHFCLLERAEAGPPHVLFLGSLEWGGPGASEVAAQIGGLVAQAERVACESQFLRASYASKGGDASGGYFRSLVSLARACGAISGIAAFLGAGPVLSVTPGAWRDLLAGLARASTEEAQIASIAGLQVCYPGKSPSRDGVWRKTHHDLAAAYWIAAWALGYQTAREFAPVWPPPAAALAPPRKPRAPRRKPTR